MTFKVTKKIIIAFILMTLGMIMIFISFFINDTFECNASTFFTIFTSSFTIFAVGMLFLMIGLVIAEVEYRQIKYEI